MITLCALADLADPGAKGFEVPYTDQGGSRPLQIIVTRLGNSVQGWVNSCPHAWVPLNMEPDQFMDFTGQFLLCSYHGAIFTLGSGVCLRGPCKGKRLLKFPVVLDDGLVKIAHKDRILE